MLWCQAMRKQHPLDGSSTPRMPTWPPLLARSLRPLATKKPQAPGKLPWVPGSPRSPCHLSKAITHNFFLGWLGVGAGAKMAGTPGLTHRLLCIHPPSL